MAAAILTSVSDREWFSASVRLVVLMEHAGGTEFVDSVLLMRARDWDDAIARALESGRKLETSYRNVRGERVDWRLAETLTLDQLGQELPDDAEVYSRAHEAPRGMIPFDAVFSPEESRPGHAGVPFDE